MSLELIVELSGCHGGSLDNAKRLISKAKAAGCTGVKFQCFQPERLAMKRVKHPRITLDRTITEPLIDLYRQVYTPHEWFHNLIAWAAAAGLSWHSSVFDPADVAFLETLGCPRYKIASFEATDSELIEAVRATKKPFITSVNQDENVFPPREAMVLHATNYGVPPEKANLKRLRQWAWADKQFPGKQWRWGLSDHTTNDLAAEIAAVYGACMIEWHMRLPGVHTPDDAFAWLPEDISRKVRRIREIERALT